MSDESKDIFLVIKHTQVPAKGEKTHMKDWKKTGKWETYEEATVTDSPKKNLIAEASVIINVSKSRIEKNRNPQTDDAAVKNMLLSLVQKYQENLAQFYARYRPETLAALVRDKAAEKSQQLAKEAKEISSE